MGLTRRHEAAYAGAEWGLSGVETFVRLHLLFYFTNICKIEPALAGFLVALGVFWDGLIDPLVGWLSDRTRTRLGPRIPYILLGLVVLPLLLVGLFRIEDLSGPLKIAAALMIYLFLNTAMTLISVPHAALAGDLSQAKEIRTRLFAWRYFFTTLGLLSGIAIPAVLLSNNGAEAAVSYWKSALGLGLIVILSTGLTLGGIWRLKRNAIDHAPPSLFSQFRRIGKNRPFLILFAAFVLATIGQAINSSLALYYYRYTLKLEEKELQTILVVFTLVIIVSILFWNILSRHFAQKKLLALGVGSLGILSSIVYPLLHAGESFGAMVMAVLGGILVGSVFLLEVMVAETVDAKDPAAGDYGAYFGLWKLGSKIARAAGIGLTGLLLNLIHFQPDGPYDADSVRKLAWLFGPGVGFFFVIGALTVLFYPLGTASKNSPIA